MKKGMIPLKSSKRDLVPMLKVYLKSERSCSPRNQLLTVDSILVHFVALSPLDSDESMKASWSFLFFVGTLQVVGVLL